MPNHSEWPQPSGNGPLALESALWTAGSFPDSHHSSIHSYTTPPKALPALLPARDAGGHALCGLSIFDLHRAAGSVSLPLTDAEASAFDNLNTPEEWRQAQATVAASQP